MQVFLIQNKDQVRTPPNFHISIDPGINSGGITLLNKLTKKITTGSHPGTKGRVAGQSFPFLYPLLQPAAQSFYSIVQKLLPENGVNSQCAIGIEIPYHGGVAATRLQLLAVRLLDLFKLGNFHSISMVPTNLNVFFTKSKRPANSQIFELITANFPKLERISTHIADSLLISVLLNHKFYQDHFSVTMREPSFKTTVIEEF